MPTLDRLTAVRSQLAIGLEAYLRAFVDLSAWPGSPSLGGRSLADVYVQPNVVRRDRLDETTIARRREVDRRAEFVPEPGRFEQTPSAAERARVRRAVILGRPGEGRTILTQITCRDVARKSLRALAGRTRLVSEIPVPIWLRVEEVLRDGSIKSAADRVIRNAVADAVTRYFPDPAERPSPAPASAHIVAAVERAPTWLFLDAVDERPAKLDSDPRQALRALADLPCRIVLTARPYAYDRSYRGELPFSPTGDGAAREYALAPLTPAQRTAFVVERWFRHDADAAARVRKLVEEHPQFRDLATNGLLLTLICATTERHALDPGTTRRVHLPDLAVRDMASRAHKPKPLDSGSTEVEKRLLVLARVAWVLLQARPAEKWFWYQAWHEALHEACAAERTVDGPRFADALTKALEDAGLLATPMIGHRMFLHRTFHKYLAAARLARRALQPKGPGRAAGRSRRRGGLAGGVPPDDRPLLNCQRMSADSLSNVL